MLFLFLCRRCRSHRYIVTAMPPTPRQGDATLYLLVGNQLKLYDGWADYHKSELEDKI